GRNSIRRTGEVNQRRADHCQRKAVHRPYPTIDCLLVVVLLALRRLLPPGRGNDIKACYSRRNGHAWRKEMKKLTAHRLSPLLIALGFCLFASLAHAQRSPKKHNQPPEQAPVYDAPNHQDDLSGRFTFARIRFDVGAYWAGMPLGDNGPPWSHDYPDAGRHLMQIMADLTKLHVTLGQNQVIYALCDPELFNEPVPF